MAIDPANIVLVTVPVSPDVMTVPVVAGKVKTVPVPAVAAGIISTDPELEPGIVIDKTPPNAKFADARFKATPVVPMYTVEFPRTVLGIVPTKLPAVRFVKLAPLTAPNKPDHVPVVTVPVVVKLVEPAKGDAPTEL